MTQLDILAHHFHRNGSISQREALIEYSIQSLTKRISELRGEGFDIVTVFKRNPVTGQRYARYVMR
jgi:hypothetical protein